MYTVWYFIRKIEAIAAVAESAKHLEAVKVSSSSQRHHGSATGHLRYGEVDYQHGEPIKDEVSGTDTADGLKTKSKLTLIKKNEDANMNHVKYHADGSEGPENPAYESEALGSRSDSQHRSTYIEVCSCISSLSSMSDRHILKRTYRRSGHSLS